MTRFVCLLPLLALIGSAVGCGDSSSEVIECTPATMCLKNGVQGRCRVSPASSRSFCAYPDTSCPGGERWGLFAGDDLADVCVVPPDAGIDPDGATGERLVFEPTEQDFGSVVANQQSAEASLTLRNQGASTTGTIVAALSGPDADQFLVTDDRCTGSALAAGGSCFVKIRLAPRTAGSKTASLVATASPGGMASATVRGQGLNPGALTITPASHAFPGTSVGGASAAQSFVVTNTGGAASGTLAVGLTDATHYRLVSGCTAPLAAAATCTVMVTFEPTSAGSKLSSIEVSATPGGTTAASISGTGLAPAQLQVTPATRDLGLVFVTAQSTPAMITVRNTGDVPSGAVTVSLASGATTQFAISNDTCGAAIAAGATCTLNVRFVPTSSGSKSAILAASASPGGTAMSMLMGEGYGVPVFNGQGADQVLGQMNYSSKSINSGGLSASSMSAPARVATAGSRLWVGDSENHRVLQWSALPTMNMQAADVVAGQPSATATGVSPTQIITGVVNGVCSDGIRLYVADGHSRVLVWNSIPTATGAAASIVLGQGDFMSSNSGAAANQLEVPAAIACDASRLIVADPFASRVLIWSPPPTTNMEPADIVLGRSDFGIGFGSPVANPPTASSMSAPSGLAYDGQRLFVADAGNNRVLVWNSIPSTNGAAADYVIGQSAFNLNPANAGGARSASGFDSPGGLALSRTTLFVADRGNNRVLVFTPIPTAMGGSAAAVLGQADFTLATVPTFPTAGLFLSPKDLAVSGNRLFVADADANRVVRFTLAP